MIELAKPLDMPVDIGTNEMPAESSTMAAAREMKPVIPVTPQSPAILQPKPSRKALGKSKRKPWADLDSGLSAAEEMADPSLAEAIRESLWAARVGRVEVDDEGLRIETPPPERPGSSRTSSNSSTSSTKAAIKLEFNEDFSLTPKPPPPLALLARDETSMDLKEIMSCISAEDLRKVARARKVPSNQLLNREAVCAALSLLAKRQTVLGFTPKRSTTQSTLPFASKSITSESLLIAQLLPYLDHRAIQLTSPLHSLIARVNLIFSRTPPVSSSSASLMLPSILVTSHRRRYPTYGSPTRSLIWESRLELLTWERAVHWEAVVGDALGDSWAEVRRNPGGNVPRPVLGRVEGARVVKRIWEGVWPIWSDMVAGDGGKEVDPSKEKSGLAGDRFKTGSLPMSGFADIQVMCSLESCTR